MRVLYECIEEFRKTRNTRDFKKQASLLIRINSWMKLREGEYLKQELEKYKGEYYFPECYTLGDYMRDYASYEAYCKQADTDKAIGFDEWILI